jgi:putative ABC transport system permease protein
MTRIPLLARLIARSFPASDRDAVLGDLLEEITRRRRNHESVLAWLGAQALRSALPNLTRSFRTNLFESIGPRARGDAFMRTILQDVRYALRLIRNNAGFAAVLAGTLGLGIGANTLIFSLVDGVVLNPFPFPEPARLIGIGPVYPRLNRDLSFWEVLSPAEFQDIQNGTTTLERVVAWDMGNRELAGEGPPERVFTAFWWGDALETLNVRAHLGRGFLPEETAQGERVALLSYRVWQRLFGGDPSIIGRAVGVNGAPHTVVGVMPPGTLIYGTDLWTPMPVGPEVFPRARRQFQVLARMRAGVTMTQVESDLARIASQVERDNVAELEEYAGWKLVPATWNDINVRTLRPAALVLSGAVAFVLLLVCVNVASLALARSAGRRREVAVRAALGAARSRIARQLLTESVVLAALGAIPGLLLAFAGTRALAAVIPTLGLPMPGDIAVDGRVLAFTAAITIGVGVLTGLAPALGALRSDVQSALRSEGTHGSTARGRQRVQRAFVAVEVMLAMILLVGGGLLLNSFLRLQRVDPGFDASNVLTMRLTLPPERYQNEQITTFFQTLRERVEALPGVRSAGVASQFPGIVFARRQFEIIGAPPAREGTLPSAYATTVDDAYFKTLGLSPLSGRFPERGEARLVGVVNQALAQQYFPGEDPVGRQLRFGDEPLEIIGVAPSVLNAGLERPPEPEAFAPMDVVGGGNQFFLMVRTSVDPDALLTLIREAVRSIDAEQPIYAIRTMEEAFAGALAARRFTTLSLAVFAMLALILAAVGIYAVVAFAVSERTREIGVRVALGAKSGQVRWLVVRQALVPVIIGGVLGLGGAIAVGRLLASQLFDVAPADPATLLAVVAGFGLVALLASYIPARRATRLDPLRALRLE